MEKRPGPRKNVVIIMLGTAAFAAAAMAQSLDSADSTAGAYYAPEEGMCSGTGSGDGILSVGGTHTDATKVACWAEYNSCKQKLSLNVGDMWGGRQGGTRYLYPDSYYEDGECGWATNVGSIARYSSLYIYFGEALALVTSSSTDTSIKWKIEAWDYQGDTNCSGGYDNYWSESWNCCGFDVWAGDQNAYRDLADYGIGDCGSTDADSGGCQMPDMVIPIYGSPTSAIKFRISMYVCDDSASCSSNCSAMSYQEGCFYLDTY
ncbi:MAG: hypothetical protein HY905_03600 [Deltaproteobacteria bacterium]|nr:hypothetical protein [Deltaproteobacteria bacterium]